MNDPRRELVEKGHDHVVLETRDRFSKVAELDGVGRYLLALGLRSNR